jgi:hypothetical protein
VIPVQGELQLDGFCAVLRTMSPAKNKKRTMSAAHKEALAVGRNESRAVRRYLEALDAHKPKRGRKRTPDSINKRLAKIDGEIGNAAALKRVELIQERMNLQRELEALEGGSDLSELEAEFVSAAKGYGERKGISYGAWREAGVPAAVLSAAGIGRGA